MRVNVNQARLVYSAGQVFCPRGRGTERMALKLCLYCDLFLLGVLSASASCILLHVTSIFRVVLSS